MLLPTLTQAFAFQFWPSGTGQRNRRRKRCWEAFWIGLKHRERGSRGDSGVRRRRSRSYSGGGTVDDNGGNVNETWMKLRRLKNYHSLIVRIVLPNLSASEEVRNCLFIVHICIHMRSLIACWKWAVKATFHTYSGRIYTAFYDAMYILHASVSLSVKFKCIIFMLP